MQTSLHKVGLLLLGTGCISVTKIQHASPKQPGCTVETIGFGAKVRQSFDVTCLINHKSLRTENIESLHPYACLCGADAIRVTSQDNIGLQVEAIRYNLDGPVLVRDNPPPQPRFEEKIQEDRTEEEGLENKPFNEEDGGQISKVKQGPAHKDDSDE